MDILQDMLNDGTHKALAVGGPAPTPVSVAKQQGSHPSQSMLFFNSQGWSTVVSIILTFYTSALLGVLEQWRSGLPLLGLLIITCVVWWDLVRVPLHTILTADPEQGAMWNMGVQHVLQAVTLILIFSISQLGLPLLMSTWTRIGLGPGESIIMALILLMLGFFFIGNMWRSAQLLDFPDWFGGGRRRNRTRV